MIPNFDGVMWGFNFEIRDYEISMFYDIYVIALRMLLEWSVNDNYCCVFERIYHKHNISWFVKGYSHIMILRLERFYQLNYESKILEAIQ